MYLGFTFYYVKKGGGKQLLKSHIIKLLQLFTLLPFSESIVNMVPIQLLTNIHNLREDSNLEPFEPRPNQYQLD